MLDEKILDWIDSCKTLDRLSIVIPSGVVIDCLVYVDKNYNTITDDGIGPIIHSVLNIDIQDEKTKLARDFTLIKYKEELKEKGYIVRGL